MAQPERNERMADRDTNRFDRPYDPEETARQVNENGCTYHSGRMNEGPFDPGIPQTPPDGEYHYSYRDTHVEIDGICRML